MMKLNYNIQIHHELTDNWMQSVFQVRCKYLFVTLERACRCNGRVLHWSREQKNHSSLLECHAFTFLSFHQKTWLSEEFNKDLKLASREPNDFIASNGSMAPANAKIFHCYKQEWFYNAEKLCEELRNNFYSMHQNYKKKLKIEYYFFV
jgi:hypothetical protein